MEELRQLEILWITFLQTAAAWLAVPMRLVSHLGDEEFYLAIMPLLYWSVDAVFGARIAAMLLFSNGLSHALKVAFHTPRPYWYDSSIRALSTETTFGLPSGHAMNAASIWGLAAAAVRKQGWKTLLIILILLIGFSRILLGVHFTYDVLIGWIFGVLLLVLFLRFEQPVMRWAKALPLKSMLLAALLSALALGGLELFSVALFGSWQVPAVWFENALAAAPEVQPDPQTIEGAFTNAGTWFGMMAGLAWLYHRQGGYRADGTLAKRVLRYIIGLVGVGIFWFGLGEVFPREANAVSYALRFLRYALVGVWVSALAPLLFQRLGLCAAKQLPPTTAPAENPL